MPYVFDTCGTFGGFNVNDPVPSCPEMASMIGLTSVSVLSEPILNLETRPTLVLEKRSTKDLIQFRFTIEKKDFP